MRLAPSAETHKGGLSHSWQRWMAAQVVLHCEGHAMRQYCLCAAVLAVRCCNLHNYCHHCCCCLHTVQYVTCKPSHNYQSKYLHVRKKSQGIS